MLNKRLEFFERDPIDWGVAQGLSTHNPIPARFALYKRLLDLRASHAALKNGNAGGSLVFLHTGNAEVLRFVRTSQGESVEVSINLSNQEQLVQGKTFNPWGWDIRLF